MSARAALLAGVAALVAVPASRSDDRPPEPSPNLKPKPPEPVPGEKLDAAIRRGVAFLLANQNKDGSWGTPALKGGVPIIAGIGSHHAYGVAVTAMCVSALIETGGVSTDVARAIERGEAHL